jgi:fumarate hydratase class I
MQSLISEDDFVTSIAEGLQYISCYHPPDYISHLSEAYGREKSEAARNAIAQILLNSRMAAMARRPICQDTGVVNVFIKLGVGARLATSRALADLVNVAVRAAYTDKDNPLRASMVRDPEFDRTNTRDNTPAITHVEVVEGNAIAITVAAKGGGSENKARFTVLRPAASAAEWVVSTVEQLGAGWCPPGIIGIGIGGSAEKSMLLAKQSLLEPIDMTALLERGPSNRTEEMRIALYERINALGIGAQGLGGMTTVVDVKVRTHPAHAASKPVSLIPQCAADRHISFTLDGSGPAVFTPPSLDLWPDIGIDEIQGPARRVNLATVSRAEVAAWKAGETLLLSGTMLTARDAAHARLVSMIGRGEALPVDLRGRCIYYVGPVDAVRDEVIGPAGPTTSTRMDPFTEAMLQQGLLLMIGKAERGPETVDAIRRHGAAYLIAVGGAAYLVSKAVKSSRLAAFEDLGMEAIREFTVEDMPVTVAVSAGGDSVHTSGPALWRSNARASSQQHPATC